MFGNTSDAKDQVSVVESNCSCIVVNAVGIKNDEQKAAQAAMLL